MAQRKRETPEQVARVATSRKRETPAEQVARVAKRFARTHDLGLTGGWFDKECRKFTNPLGVAWFTALIIVELTVLDQKENASHVAAFVLDLDSI